MNERLLKNRYRIEERLGKGTFGEVYRATDLQTGEPVAVKTMNTEFVDSMEYRKRFAREVIVLQKISHPNIVGYIDAFANPKQAFLVMEYVSGGTLEDVFKKYKKMSEGVFKGLMPQILDAMATAHERGIIHRDLKPANILMTITGVPKIGDFGLARLNELSTMTQTGTMMGTLAYMPPEAFDALAKLDYRGDIWALGVILFQAFTGQFPFRGNTQPSMIASILHDDPIPLSTIRHDLPLVWESIINKCLEKSPHDRYQTVRELSEDVRSEKFSFASTVIRNPKDDEALFSMVSLSEGQFVEVDWDFDNEDYDFQVVSPSPMPKAQNALIPVDSVPPKKIKPYALQFISSEADDRYGVPSPMPTALPKIRYNRDVAKGRHWADAPQKKNTVQSMGIMMVGGALTWIGIMLTMLGVFLFFTYFLPSAESFQVDLDVIAGMWVVGGLAFVVGVAMDVFVSERLEERLLLGSIAVGALIIWGTFYSGFIFLPGFLSGLVGMIFYMALIMFYFTAKR